MLTREEGKPLVENEEEVEWVIGTLDYYAEMARTYRGRLLAPAERSQFNFVMKEPYGVVACIVPFNYPLLLMIWKVAPSPKVNVRLGSIRRVNGRVGFWRTRLKRTMTWRQTLIRSMTMKSPKRIAASKTNNASYKSTPVAGVLLFLFDSNYSRGISCS